MDLPLTEEGFVNCSAEFGHHYVVVVTYNTNPKGEWVPFEDHSNQTWHGPMDLEEAQRWIKDYPEDTDIKDIEIGVMNKVRADS